MYLVKIVCASIEEIARVNRSLELDLWAGVKTKSKEYADSIACAAYDVAPWIEIDVCEAA